MDERPPRLGTIAGWYGLTLGEALTSYEAEVLSGRYGAKSDLRVIQTVRRAELAGLLLANVTRQAIEAHCAARLTRVGQAAVADDLRVIRRAIELVRGADGFRFDNPALDVSLPVAEVPGPSALDAQQLQAFYAVLDQRPVARSIMDFAGVAMELTQRDILALRWTDLELNERIVSLPGARDAIARAEPLTGDAVAILRQQPVAGALVFPIVHAHLQRACQAACEKAGIRVLPFHMLRRVIQRSPAPSD